jgi:hypothetical protein
MWRKVRTQASSALTKVRSGCSHGWSHLRRTVGSNASTSLVPNCTSQSTHPDSGMEPRWSEDILRDDTTEVEAHEASENPPSRRTSIAVVETNVASVPPDDATSVGIDPQLQWHRQYIDDLPESDRKRELKTAIGDCGDIFDWIEVLRSHQQRPKANPPTATTGNGDEQLPDAAALWRMMLEAQRDLVAYQQERLESSSGGAGRRGR